MIVSVNEITGALQKIRAMVADEKTVAGVMLRFNGNTLGLGCTTGRKSILQNIEVEDCNINRNLIVDYKMLCSVIDSCQQRGSIVVDNLEFEIKDNSIEFTIRKKIRVVKDNEEQFLLGGVNNTEIGYKDDNEATDMKARVLTRVDYDSLLNVDNYDEYSVSEFRNIITRMVGEKNKVIYISPKKSSAFVAYTAFMAVVPVVDKTLACVIPVATAKAMLNTLSREKEDTVLKISAENQFIRMTDGEGFGSMWEMGAVIENNITVLNRYEEKDYTTFMIDLHREMLLDTLSSVESSTGSERASILFSEEDECICLRFVVAGSNTSIKGGYKVICEGLIGNIPEGSYELSIKCLIDMVTKCQSDYIGFDFNVDVETGIKTLRVSEMDIEERINKTYQFKNEAGIDNDEPIDVMNKIRIRNESLGSKMYTLIK